MLPLYRNTKNSYSFKLWSCTKFDQPSVKNIPSVDFSIETYHVLPVGPSSIAVLFPASFPISICFTNFDGILYERETNNEENDKSQSITLINQMKDLHTRRRVKSPIKTLKKCCLLTVDHSNSSAPISIASIEVEKEKRNQARQNNKRLKY